jgi:bifunctional non-homologous end joining protein LigD
MKSSWTVFAWPPIDNGRVQLLTRTGLDWTGKYPSAAAALANLNVKTAYLDGELCGVDAAGLPSFAHTQAATDGERGVRLVYYAFDLLHLDGWDVSGLQLIERKALLEPLLATSLAFSSMAMTQGIAS